MLEMPCRLSLQKYNSQIQFSDRLIVLGDSIFRRVNPSFFNWDAWQKRSGFLIDQYFSYQAFRKMNAHAWLSDDISIYHLQVHCGGDKTFLHCFPFVW